MGKEGMGVGSASIVLIFAVLCLTVFALISLSSVKNDKALTDSNVKLVKAYYEADTLAECILADIMSGGLQETVRGIEITTGFDMDIFADTVSFDVPILNDKVLHVAAAFGFDGTEILIWSMRDLREWHENEDHLPVWDGEF
jgi:hypothetical protein